VLSAVIEETVIVPGCVGGEVSAALAGGGATVSMSAAQRPVRRCRIEESCRSRQVSPIAASVLADERPMTC
jgi:hypothetical protein